MSIPAPELRELRVERPVHGGRCVALPADAAGAADAPAAAPGVPAPRRVPLVLLAGGIPGERVVARIETRKGVAFGEVVEVLEASPDRVAAPAHPGLDLGHVALARQLELKHAVLLDAARRAGVTLPAEVPPVAPSPRTWGYRSAVQPAVAVAGTPAALGYRRPGAHDVVPLDEDPTANPACAAAWNAVTSVGLPAGVREVAIRGNDDGEALIALVAAVPARAPRGHRASPARAQRDPSSEGDPGDPLETAHALVRAGVAGVALAPYDARGRFRGGAQRLAGARSMRQRYGDVELTLTATAFAQPNPEAAGALFRELAAWAPTARHALDLYGGNGVIGLHLAPRSERVTVIEIDRGAVERGRADAQRMGANHVMHVRLDARELRVPDDVDLVCVDPPRAGLAAATRQAIVESRAKTLIYVSCDVATWARDVADLQRAGFRLERVRPFDFQPHTHHLEILSLLRR
ncbi:MAG: class I SAM-dependent RNA methyltransferase [Trueperaceae bacterium]